MPPDPEAGTGKRAIRVGKYLVNAHIATGGMGAVYRATDTETQREVALKILSPELAARAVMLERFRREARSAAKLVHPNIVALYEFGEAQGAYFLAMEYVDGVDLQAFLREKGPLDWRLAKLILFQAAQALHHANKQGIVHRDIKPSNFLVTRSDPPAVKMTDLGLAREVDEEEFRVTREGTTVGTIDYMSPEQARDSGSADIRSDIYSLGCTFFHMLTGRAPFAEGSLTERIFKHMEEAPPDLRQLKPKVPASLVKILEKMLAKKPDERFQSPKELLRALSTKSKSSAEQPSLRESNNLVPVVEITSEDTPSEDKILTGNELLTGLLDDGEGLSELPANEDEEPALPPLPSRAKRREEPAPARKSSRTTDQDSDPGGRDKTKVIARDTAPHQPPPWLLIGGAAAVLATLVVGAVFMVNSLRGPAGTDTEPFVENATGPGRIVRPIPTPPTGLMTGKRPDDPPPPPSRWQPVDAAAPKYDPVATRTQFLEGWDRPALAADAAVLRLLRLPTGPKDFDSLPAACSAAAKESASDIILEIHDNGPLYLTPAALSGKNLVLRAAPGFRPLLVWDVPLKGEDSALIKLHKGHLILENVELVSRCPAGMTRSLTFLKVQTGGIWLDQCTFSVTGLIIGGAFSVAQITGDAPARDQPNRVRLQRCYARGSALTAVALTAPESRLLIEESLLIGGDAPLIDVRGREDGTVRGQVFRSTLICQQTAFQLQLEPPELVRFNCEWSLCDSVVARRGDTKNDALLHHLLDRREISVRWQVRNCVYPGWTTLLRAGTRTISTSQLATWRNVWNIPYGDAATTEAWPTTLPPDLADTPARECSTDLRPGEPVGYAAATGEGTIGCPLNRLPPQRDLWRKLTFETYVGPPVELLTSEAPEIPKGGDGYYHGERIDVSTYDLGAYLTEQLAKTRPAERIVLHLYASRPGKTLPCSPIALKGSSLVLYFEPQPREGGGMERLVLNAESKKATKHAALIEVDNGSLDLIGGVIQYPNYTLALVPPALLRVSNGRLRVHDCQLLGPTTAPTRNYRGLIQLEGKDVALDEAPICAISDSVLVSAVTAIQLSGASARLRCTNSVILADGTALLVQPQPATVADGHLLILFEHCTLAARRAVVQLQDDPKRGATALPVVVQSLASAYLQPFADKGGLLRVDGQALPRGVVLWQSDKDLYDRRLHFAYQIGETVSDKPQPASEWSRLWGPGIRQPVVDRVFQRTFMGDKWPYDALVVPPAKGTLVISQRPDVGADLFQLGLVKK